jgi:hypothetical protein
VESTDTTSFHKLGSLGRLSGLLVSFLLPVADLNGLSRDYTKDGTDIGICMIYLKAFGQQILTNLTFSELILSSGKHHVISVNESIPVSVAVMKYPSVFCMVLALVGVCVFIRERGIREQVII